MEHTNKELLLALRKELLRRKEFVEKASDYLEYDRNKYYVKTDLWAYDVRDRMLYLDYNILKKGNPFSYDGANIKKRDNSLRINYTYYTGDINNDIAIDHHKNGNVIIPEERIKEYLDYLDYLKEVLHNPISEANSSCFALLNWEYRLCYNSCDDTVDINNDDNGILKLQPFYEVLDRPIDEEKTTDYMLSLLEDRSDLDKEIKFDPNGNIILAKHAKYSVNDNEEEVILKRIRLSEQIRRNKKY